MVNGQRQRFNWKRKSNRPLENKAVLELNYEKKQIQYGKIIEILKLSAQSGNDYKQAHNDGKRRRRETGTSVDLSASLDDYDSSRCLAYIAE